MTNSNKNAFLALIRILTPTHVGIGGQALSIIDLPIQRERHTQWPTIYGSSLKGALKDYARLNPCDSFQNGERMVKAVFGTSENMGAIIFGDAILLLYPVKSWDKIFIWLTSPYAMIRYVETLRLLGIEDPDTCNKYIEKLNEIRLDPNSVISFGEDLPKTVYIEDVEYNVKYNEKLEKDLIANILEDISTTLSISKKALRERTFIASDQVFDSIVTTKTMIQARIQLSEHKTVAQGPWYEEYIPPETILYVPLIKNLRVLGNNEKEKCVECWLKMLSKGIIFSVGGNETIGRGIVYIRSLHRDKSSKG